VFQNDISKGLSIYGYRQVGFYDIVQGMPGFMGTYFIQRLTYIWIVLLQYFVIKINVEGSPIFGRVLKRVLIFTIPDILLDKGILIGTPFLGRYLSIEFIKGIISGFSTLLSIERQGGRIIRGIEGIFEFLGGEVLGFGS